jgi:acyl-coenzyme A thioesterase PaaI-like protein
VSPPLSELQAVFAEVGCFVCGSLEKNAHGLGLVFEETPAGACTRFTLPSAYRSYPGFLHGGVVSAVLDETIAYASLFKHRLLPFTRHLSLTFRRGVSPDRPNICYAEVQEVAEDGFRGRAWIEGPEGSCLARATGDFAFPTLAMAERLMPGADLSRIGHYFRR